MNKFIKVSGLRFSALSLVLLTNLMVIKLLSSDQVGRYYIFVTVSYVGNAIFFVGVDFLLQKRIQPTGIKREINFEGLNLFLIKTAGLGFVLVFISSCIYFLFFYDWGAAVNLVDLIGYSAICAFGSVALYLSAGARNVLLVSDDLIFSNLQLFLDGFIKLGMALLGFFVMEVEKGIYYFFVLSIGGGIAGLIGFVFIRYRYSGSGDGIGISYKDIITHVAPVGASGVSNLVQLQGYRLYLGRVGEIVALGAISFLTSLGATATNAVLSIISQKFIPKIYVQPGKNIRAYVIWLTIASVGLALASWPSAKILVYVLEKDILTPYIWMVPVGVLVEFGNSLIGAVTHYYNAQGKSLIPLSVAGFLASIVSCLVLISFYDVFGAAKAVASALVIGQITAIAYIYFKTDWSTYVKC